MGEVMFAAEQVAFGYGGAEDLAVRDVDLAVAEGEFVALVGPNGSGKTTLLRLLLGALRSTAGRVFLLGQPIEAWRPLDVARIVGVVTQREEPTFPLRVRQAVMMGRYPHLGPIGAPRAADHAAVMHALERCDARALADRWTTTLSGGEWQRVRIARALAQEPRALVLDEPTANLDIRHEMELFELVAALVRGGGLAGLLVTHHVNLAARYADRIVVMDRGTARAVGAPREVLTRELLEAVFRWPVEIVTWRGVPQYLPLGQHDRPPADTHSS